ncbi:hypothetical protein Pcinc_024594 [Petrolisthes cinctipes]|uniref:Cytochrome P450 n=1 Tax=Petrolisthes cinctipes TaxID=88211 RepID=A0AAE1FCB1_PETCI|nr:hypothetical protein Pcinc_024594 [Petrolisthes cinctipes]
MIVEALLCVSLLVLLYLSLRKPPGLPPGRWGLPLVGYVPLTTRSIPQQLADLRNKHGDIYMWRIGTQIQVFLHDHQLIKEAFTRPEFQDRVDFKGFRFMDPNKLGLVQSNGEHWHNNRRFTLRQLRDLGMGKSKLVSAVQSQSSLLVQEFKKQAGRPAPIPNTLSLAIINVIWHMVSGKEFSLTDPKITQFCQLLNEALERLNLVIVPDYLPWLYSVLPNKVIGRVFGIDRTSDTRNKLYKYFIDNIEEHQRTLDPNNPRDFIDGYLMEMEGRKDDPQSTLSEEDLTVLIFDLFVAGFETTTNTLIWITYYLASNPQVQRKMQAEIDQVLPLGTQATLQDRARLPYTEAVIHESLRKSSLLAVGVPHMATQNTTLGGYIIPKGTSVGCSTVTVHNSCRYWDKPDHFQPERWLDENNKFTSKKEGFIPFSIGKRQCAGESLARMELLIFTTALFQSLNFSIPPGNTLSLEANPGDAFVSLPIRQDLIVTIRK